MRSLEDNWEIGGSKRKGVCGGVRPSSSPIKKEAGKWRKGRLKVRRTAKGRTLIFGDYL